MAFAKRFHAATVAVVTSDHGPFSPRPPNVLTQRAMETAAPAPMNMVP